MDSRNLIKASVWLSLLVIGAASQVAQATHTAELVEWQVPGPSQPVEFVDQVKDIAIDAQGGIWYIYRGQGLDLVIGRLDPCTNTVRTWQVDAGDVLATNVQSFALDAQGRLYWTAPGDPDDPTRNPYVGRLNPFANPAEPNLTLWFTGEILGAVRPWDLAFDARGLLWVTDPEGHRLVDFLIDPRTSEAQVFSWSLPPSSRPTDIAIDDQGSVWFIEANHQNFRTSIGRMDLTATSFPTTFTEWDVSAGGNLMVREGLVWTSSAPFLFDLPPSQGPADILRLDPIADKLTRYQIEGLARMAFDPQTASKLWFTTTNPFLPADAVGALELRDKPAVHVRRATGELSPMPPLLIIVKPVQRVLKEEKVPVPPQLQTVTATTQPDLQLNLLPSGQTWPQELAFRGIDLFFKTAARTLDWLRPIPDDAQGPLPMLCATPLKAEVKAGETAVFTLRGGPPPVGGADTTLGLEVESILPPPQSAAVKFAPYNFLGGIIGVSVTQLMVSIAAPGTYQITIKGTAMNGDFVRQNVQLTVKEKAKQSTVTTDTTRRFQCVASNG